MVTYYIPHFTNRKELREYIVRKVSSAQAIDPATLSDDSPVGSVAMEFATLLAFALNEVIYLQERSTIAEVQELFERVLPPEP
jgi:hypothetical protein